KAFKKFANIYLCYQLYYYYHRLLCHSLVHPLILLNNYQTSCCIHPHICTSANQLIIYSTTTSQLQSQSYSTAPMVLISSIQDSLIGHTGNVGWSNGSR